VVTGVGALVGLTQNAKSAKFDKSKKSNPSYSKEVNAKK